MSTRKTKEPSLARQMIRERDEAWTARDAAWAESDTLRAKLAAAEAESARLAAEVNRLQALLPDECAYPDTPGKIIARLAALLTETERERDEARECQATAEESVRRHADKLKSVWDFVHEVEAERDKARALLTEAREALEFYAEPKNWESILTINHFERAAAFPDETEHIDGRRVGGRRARSLLARLTPQAPTPESEAPDA